MIRPARTRIAAAAAAAAINLATPSRATSPPPVRRPQAISNLAQVAIVDRRTGAEMPVHFYRGEYWVAGNPGDTYSISIRNRVGVRIMAVTSVDGVNVISGENAAWTQVGYVFSPQQGYEITGWRKSDSEVAAFTFTSVPNSYAARTGRPDNVGVIGVALFREGLRAPIEPSADLASPPAPAASARAAPAPASPAFEGPAAPVNTPSLGTGHGARETSLVHDVYFERERDDPNEIIRIRYDSLTNLVAMGIIERSHPPAPTLNPFPSSPTQQYVPDPPAGN